MNIPYFNYIETYKVVAHLLHLVSVGLLLTDAMDL